MHSIEVQRRNMAKKDIVKDFTQKIAGRNFSVVLPEGRDERIIQAARTVSYTHLTLPTTPYV